MTRKVLGWLAWLPCAFLIGLLALSIAEQLLADRCGPDTHWGAPR